MQRMWWNGAEVLVVGFANVRHGGGSVGSGSDAKVSAAGWW